MARAKKILNIATVDVETDPFLFGRIPKPFALEFYCASHNICEVFWGDDCVTRWINWLEKQPEPFLIYAHNGGKFDFHFFTAYLENPCKIINARIVEAHIVFENTSSGEDTVSHRLRDSFAIMPYALAKMAHKIEIDITKLERHCREKHKAEILTYLHQDCVGLSELVVAFIERFGPKLTIGSTAMAEIKKRHPFRTMTKEDDAQFRPFYYGGRVQCFKSGIVDNGPWKCFDVNSMYPKAMRDYRHPINGAFETSRELPPDFERPYFLHFRGRNRGALPKRSEYKAELSFNEPDGEFYACSHEIQVALKYGLIDIDEIIACHVAVEFQSMGVFVDEFYKQKQDAKANGDSITELFAKFLLNSGYGKYGQNPDNFSDWFINREWGNDEALTQAGYSLDCEFEDFELWSKPTENTEHAYFDVSIAASITSAARAMMLEGIQHATEPLYCDTDSLICRDFRGDVDKLRLGAWKYEWTAPAVAIAGKKLYAAYDPSQPMSQKPIKLVSKGGGLKLAELVSICQGSTVEFHNQAPTFSLIRPTDFITRNFRMTVDPVSQISSQQDGDGGRRIHSEFGEVGVEIEDTF